MEAIQHPLNEAEATQIACRIVDAYGGNVNLYRFIKLLYLVEREAWAKLEQPAMGGTYFSHPDGPMISETADAAKKGRMKIWSEHLSRQRGVDGFQVTLVKPAGRDEISDALLEIVDGVIRKTKSWTNEKLQVHCHQLKEYTQPPSNGRLPITAEDILEATGKTQARIKKLQSESELWEKLDAALA